MILRAGLMAAIFPALLLVADPCVANGAECAVSRHEAATVAAVEARLELRLDDGRLLRLFGIEAAGSTSGDPALAERARAQFATQVAGHAVTLQVLDRTPDRWGRLAALVAAGDGQDNLAVTALAAGLARYNGEPAAHDCREAFLAAEAEARLAARGLWRDPSYSVLAADDHAAFDLRSATFVVAEGRLTGVDAGAYRTKLRFGAHDRNGRDSLVATILPRTMKLFKTQGVDVSSLIGRRMRLRGLLDLRFGPELGLTGPDALELLPDDAAPVPPTAVVAGHG